MEAGKPACSTLHSDTWTISPTLRFGGYCSMGCCGRSANRYRLQMLRWLGHDAQILSCGMARIARGERTWTTVPSCLETHRLGIFGTLHSRSGLRAQCG